MKEDKQVFHLTAAGWIKKRKNVRIKNYNAFRQRRRAAAPIATRAMTGMVPACVGAVVGTGEKIALTGVSWPSDTWTVLCQSS